MSSQKLKFDPSPTRLYGLDDLVAGFDPDQPGSYADIPDVAIYRDWKINGGAACLDRHITAAYATHDNAISLLVVEKLARSKIVGIMGGHAACRGDDDYIMAARLASRLAAEGYLVASGGGPGVMEACHLGAAFAGKPELEDCLKEIASDKIQLAIPSDAARIVMADGSIDPLIAEQMGRFMAPAYRIRKRLGHGGGLAIPTWLYGHEPPTPLGGEIAKYFQNSIREDGLLALATHGVIYMRGSAGTLQEVFQDLAQNFYRTYPCGPNENGAFSPMVFVGPFWRETMKVQPVLEALVGERSANPARPNRHYKDYAQCVRFLDDIDSIVGHIDGFSGIPSPAVAGARAK